MNIIYLFCFVILVFCWIWLLPILCICIFFSVPFALFFLSTSIMISLTLQWWFHGQVTPNTWLRQWVNCCPWYEWFPCNRISIHETSIIAVHPHGLLCCGALAGIHFIPGSQTVFCVAPLLFYIPILGWCIRALGCIPARYDIMSGALKQGFSVIVVPGGVPELVSAETGDDCQTVQRSGFLRLAHEINVKVHCVFVKGECATFTMWKAPFHDQRVQMSLKSNIPFVFPMFLGWYGTWLPKRVPLFLNIRRIETYDKQEYYLQLQHLQKKNKALKISKESLKL